MPTEPRTGSADILYVMAADAEYGPHLKSRITPLMCGVGPVEAGVAVAAELGMREASGELPHLVVSLGSAGSARLQQAGIYQATSISYRDMDATHLGFERGVTPFLGLPAVLVLEPRVPGMVPASLSTGAAIVSGAAYDAIEADMVDMETYAIKRACDRFELPLIAIRGISDGISELRQIGDWTQYLHVIDERLAAAVDALEAAVASGTLEWPDLEN
ncbi:MAG TPA: 5'-methylthioadenosine/S-adenosylhomocysteine nucleosidase [Devosia sp.]|nr:5'-methylthioadenosine/S-adenosylhomocysteine nucleosidase [Devosia sp.]